MTYELVDCNDPILREGTERFDFANPPMNPVELYNLLGEVIQKTDALGVAAPQIGLPYRAFAIRSDEIIGCFNPIITGTGEEQIYLEEGCLSFPNLYVKVKRPRVIRVRYTTPDGNIVTRRLEGMTARVFQHELDHLDGITHTSRATRFHLDQAKKQQKKILRVAKKQKGRPLDTDQEQLLKWLTD